MNQDWSRENLSASEPEHQEEEELDRLRIECCEEIAHWLHLIFCNFCVPAPTQEQIYRAVLLYQDSMDMHSSGWKAEYSRICQMEEILRRCDVGKKLQKGSISPLRSKSVQNTLSADFDHDNNNSSVASFSSSTLGSSGYQPPCTLPQNSIFCLDGTGSSPVIRILSSNPHECLFRLPKVFQLTFFRIIIRLFTNEDDVDYRRYYEYGIEDELLDQVIYEPLVERIEIRTETTKRASIQQAQKRLSRLASINFRRVSSCSIDDAFSEGSDGGKFYGWATAAESAPSHVDSQCDEKKKIEATDSSPGSYLREATGALFCAVRFRCAPEWNSYFFKTRIMTETTDAQEAAIQCILNLVECVAFGFDLAENDSLAHLIGPTCRLLGLICMGGMEHRILKRLLFLASENKTHAFGRSSVAMENVLKMYLIRALTVATTDEKTASPMNCFIYTGGRGIELSALKTLSVAPFAEAFGFALSFRIDPTPAGFSLPNASLLKFHLNDERGISAELVAIESHDFMLVVYLYHTAIEVIPLFAHRFTPGKWYHIVIQHNATKKEKASDCLSENDGEIEIYIDGVSALTKAVRYPFDRLEGDNSMKPQIEMCRNLVGQTGALRLFNKKICAAMIKSLSNFNDGISNLIYHPAITSKQEEIDGQHAPSAANENGVDTTQGLQQNASLLNAQFMTWDPRFVSGNFVVEKGRGWHGLFDQTSVYAWHNICTQEVIHSIGGVQVLLPPFHTILSVPDDERSRLGLAGILPSLLSLLTAFLKNRENHIAFVKGEGVLIVERFIAESNDKRNLTLLKRSIKLSTETVIALKGLYTATALFSSALQAQIRSRLLLNIALWLENSQPDEVFSSAYLPMFSEVARELPKELLLEAIDLRGIFIFLPNLIRSTIPKTNDLSLSLRRLNELSACMFLSPTDLKHISTVIDIMVAAFFVKNALPQSQFNFLSHLLSEKTEDNSLQNFALSAALLICLDFIQNEKRRESNADDPSSLYSADTVTWIFVGIDVSSTDFVRSIFIKCMHFYLCLTKLEAHDIISDFFSVIKHHGKNIADFSYCAIMGFLIEGEPDDRGGFSKKETLSDLLGKIKCLEAPGGTKSSTERVTSLHLNRVEMIENVLDFVRSYSDAYIIRFLNDFLLMLKSSANGFEIIRRSKECQKSLFIFVYDAFCDGRRVSIESDIDDSESSLRLSRATKRMDLALKVYSSILGSCIRDGDEKAFNFIEVTSSLQYLVQDGQVIFCCILCYLFINLQLEGLLNVERNENVSALRFDTDVIIRSISMNGTKVLDFAGAVMHWRILRHLVGFVAGAVAANGYSTDILMTEKQFRQFNGIAIDDNTLLDLSREVMRGDINESCRHGCAALAFQALSFLDIFFALNLESSEIGKYTALVLTGSYESRLSVSQGPLLASITRLSFFLLVMLDPCHDAFGHNLIRLRRYLKWCYILSNQSKDTLPNTLDGIYVSAVYFMYQSAGKCNGIYEVAVKDFLGYKQRQKMLLNGRGLREILLELYVEKHDLLQLQLPRNAFKNMSAMLSRCIPKAREKKFMNFLTPQLPAINESEEAISSFLIHASTWSMKFCRFQSDTIDRPVILDLLVKESCFIVSEYMRVSLDASTKTANHTESRLASLDCCKSGLVITSFLEQLVCDRKNFKYSLSLLNNAAVSLCDEVLQFWTDSTNRWRRNCLMRWKFPELDFYSRILLVQNRSFNAHNACAYPSVLKKRTHKRVSIDLLKRASLSFYSGNSQHDNGSPHTVDDEHEVLGTNSLEKLSTAHGHTERDGAHQQKQHLQAGSATLPNKIVTETTTLLTEFGIASNDEKVLWKESHVRKVSLGELKDGGFLLTNKKIYFREVTNKAGAVGLKTENTSNEKVRTHRWNTNFLVDFHCRTHLLRDCGLAFLFMDNSSTFFCFETKTARDNVAYQIRHFCQVPLLRSKEKLSAKAINQLNTATHLWRKRMMSNFDYLLHLNLLAGRSFSDLTQYPVMPWVLADWTSDDLDLNNSQIYRDLSKPVGALNPDRLAALLERYDDDENFGGVGQSAFMYGSLYSSPGIVLYFMVRTEPFATLSLEFQSGTFDMPDRLFSSMSQAWASSLQSTSDFKELTPELFTCPEVLVNRNQFNFGTTQDGTPVDDVELPPWSKHSAHEFIRLHRMALESEHVSSNLHHWIDLIFGYKQRGTAAVEANNVFHFLSYDGYELDTISDPLDRQAAESHLENFGCVPHQLFCLPHPSRGRAADCFAPFYSEVYPSKRFSCFIPLNQFGGASNSLSDGAVLSAAFIADTLLVVYSDLHIGRYRVLENSVDFGAFRVSPETLQNLQHNISRPDTLSGSVASLLFAIITGEVRQVRGRRFDSAQARMSPKTTMAAVSSSVRSITKAFSFKSPSSTSISLLGSSYILSCGYLDNSISVHSAEEVHLEYISAGYHRGPITCIGLGDNGLFVTGGKDATCRVWLLDHSELAVALSDTKASNWSGTSVPSEQRLTCVRVLWGHHAPISALCVSSILDVVVSGATDNAVCVHRALSGDFVRFIQVGNDGEPARRKRGIRRIAINKFGVMVIHTEDGMLHKGTINGEILLSVDARDSLNALEISTEGEALLSGGENGHFLLRALGDLSVLYTLDLSAHGSIRCISFTQMNCTSFSKCCVCVGSNNGLLTLVYPRLVE